MKTGQLTVVGCGIQLGRDLTQRARSEFDAAQSVFCLADPLATAWLRRRRSDLVDLTALYQDGVDRRHIYQAMSRAILAPVRAGERVCAVFYGHPGVFADVAHEAIATARKEGYQAHMQPGISAEACLYADLGLDPGARGMQSFETTQFLVSEVSISSNAGLILWQVALCGDLSCRHYQTTPQRLQLLVDKLRRWYAAEHEVIIYQAAQWPLEPPRMESMPLTDVPSASLMEHSTLVIPSAGAPAQDRDMLERLRACPLPATALASTLPGDDVVSQKAQKVG